MAQSTAKDSERIPHACLICASSAEAALDKARELASRAVCSGTGLLKPCGACRDCRKVAAGIHPDVITLTRAADDKGRQKQNITVDQIRALSADAIVLPNEAKRKVYIIDGAETMNPAAQNAALKLLEEPPAAVVFLLCTVRPMQLLETVRSRCAPGDGALPLRTGKASRRGGPRRARRGGTGARGGLPQGGEQPGRRADPPLVRAE